jgi:hypothetical protein
MNETETMPTLTIVSDKPSAIQQGLDQLKRMATGTVTLIAEVAIVGFIGATIGTYLGAKSIINDCSTVNLAKVGDSYVNCTVVVPKKDGVNQPPR